MARNNHERCVMGMLLHGGRISRGLLLGAGFAVWCAAEPVSAPSFSITGAVEEAVENNAELNSLRAAWQAAGERPAQVAALPNPMVSASFMDMAEGGTWPDTNEKRFMLLQEVPWYGKRGLRKQIAETDREMLRLEFLDKARDVVMEVKETCCELYAVQRVRRILQEESETLQRMAATVETMYGAGDRSQSDMLGVRTEITMLKQRSLELDVQENALQSRLNLLLNRSAGAAPVILDALPAPANDEKIEVLLPLAAANRADVLSARTEEERYALEEKLMRRESAPDYTVGVEYRDIADGDNMMMAVLGMELPIWRSANRAGVAEARFMHEAAQASGESAARQMEFDLRDACFKRDYARRTLALYTNDLIPQADARFSAHEAGYRAGRVGFMDLLESRRILLAAREMAVMAEAAVGVEHARVERAASLVVVEP